MNPALVTGRMKGGTRQRDPGLSRREPLIVQDSATSFRTKVVWVLVLHALLLVAAFLIPAFKKEKPPVRVIQLLPQGALVQGRPDGDMPAAKTSAQAPSPVVPQPVQTKVAVPEPPAVAEEAMPEKPAWVAATPKVEKSAPSDFVTKPKPPEPVKPVVTTPKTTVAKPVVKTVKPVKVALKEVTRSVAKPNHTVSTPKAASQPPAARLATKSNAAASASSSAVSDSSADSLDAGDVKSRLSGRVGKAGVNNATAQGISGGAGGGSASEVTAYYGLIRDVYYEAWKQPVSLASQKLSATLKIRVGKNGSILQTELGRSSGNAFFDESVLEAGRSVPMLPRALPDALGLESWEGTVTFEM